jgi:hypothetical protein
MEAMNHGNGISWNFCRVNGALMGKSSNYHSYSLLLINQGNFLHARTQWGHNGYIIWEFHYAKKQATLDMTQWISCIYELFMY